MDEPPRSGFLKLPGELRTAIYKECIQSQPVRPGCRGYIHTCRASTPADRCCSCEDTICSHKRSKCNAKANLYISNPGGFLLANRQIWSESSSLYAFATTIHLDFPHLKEFMYDGITSLDLKTLLQNGVWVCVTIDIEKSLSGPRGSFDSILTEWAMQRGKDESLSKSLNITYNFKTRDQNLGQKFRHSVLLRAARTTIRVLRRRPRGENPDEVAAEIMRALYGGRLLGRWGSRRTCRSQSWGEIHQLLWTLERTLTKRHEANKSTWYFGFVLDSLVVLATFFTVEPLLGMAMRSRSGTWAYLVVTILVYAALLTHHFRSP